MLVIGVTGKRATGKTTASKILRKFGGKVFDADLVCAKLYVEHQELIARIATRFAGSVVAGKVDKNRLSSCLKNLDDIGTLEQIVHPVIVAEAKNFLKYSRLSRRKVVVLDIPLLFEGGYDRFCDKVLTLESTDRIRLARMGKSRLPQDRAGIMRLLQKNRLDRRMYQAGSDMVLRTGLSLGSFHRDLRKLFLQWTCQ